MRLRVGGNENTLSRPFARGHGGSVGVRNVAWFGLSVRGGGHERGRCTEREG